MWTAVSRHISGNSLGKRREIDSRGLVDWKKRAKIRLLEMKIQKGKMEKSL